MAFKAGLPTLDEGQNRRRHGDTIRVASMVALDDLGTLCWRFDGTALKSVMEGELALQLELRLRAHVLQSVRIFHAVPETELVGLAKDICVLHLQSGEQIFAEGDAADALYVIERGSVDFVRGGERIGGLVAGEGGCFGEAALYGGGAKRRATAVAASTATVYVVQFGELSQCNLYAPTILPSRFTCTLTAPAAGRWFMGRWFGRVRLASRHEIRKRTSLLHNPRNFCTRHRAQASRDASSKAGTCKR